MIAIIFTLPNQASAAERRPVIPAYGPPLLIEEYLDDASDRLPRSRQFYLPTRQLVLNTEIAQ